MRCYIKLNQLFSKCLVEIHILHYTELTTCGDKRQTPARAKTYDCSTNERKKIIATKKKKKFAGSWWPKSCLRRLIWPYVRMSSFITRQMSTISLSIKYTFTYIHTHINRNLPTGDGREQKTYELANYYIWQQQQQQ